MVVRPPPLQLKVDNTRYGRNLLRSRMAPKSFFARVYDMNWRMLIVAVSTVNATRYLFSSLLVAYAFQGLQLEDGFDAMKQTAIYTTIGIIYISALLIEIFGIFSVVTCRLRMIRIYVHLAFLSALLVTAAGVLVAVAYFEFAEEMVKHCISFSKDGKVIKLIYRGIAEMTGATVTSVDMQTQCLNTWSSESSSQILSVFLLYFLPSTVTFLLAHTFYRQCMDPYHSASLCSQMHAGSGRHPYARLAATATYISPVCSPIYLTVYPQRSVARESNPNSTTTSIVPSSRYSASATPASSTSARSRRSGSSRRGRIPWFKPVRKSPLYRRSRSDLSLSSVVPSISPGPPSYSGPSGYAYEAPLETYCGSAESDRKFM